MISQPTESAPENLASLLHRLVRTLTVQETRELAEVVGGPGQLALLRAVVADPGQIQAAAAARLGLDKSSVSRTARRLESMGLIDRRRGRRDRRARELHPTLMGRSVEDVARPHDLSPAVRLVCRVTAADTELIDQRLRTLLAGLEVSPSALLRLRFPVVTEEAGCVLPVGPGDGRGGRA